MLKTLSFRTFNWVSATRPAVVIQFWQDLKCRRPRTFWRRIFLSIGKRSKGILYLIRIARIASQKACFSRKKEFLSIGSTVNKWTLRSLLMLQFILTLFYMMFYFLLVAVLIVQHFFDFWCYILLLWLMRDYLKIEFRYVLLYRLIPWRLYKNFDILPDKFPIEWIPPYFAGNENWTRSVGLKVYLCNNTLMKVSTEKSGGFNRCEIPRMVLMKYV